ncbi:MAG: LacI family transcriptional regulator [Brevibacterium sp.]|nr:LacI family transcriptional regulator [Brevibacterium sp.]MDN6174594.1 LacI family transcriptional regulator [Brevibacterium sp.]MDN6188234.1 LacI family transcriptional regulator [Brevibacterium sp.]MDN6191827.1 LacI family transcriptional regulator [Brevibacterium sp.]MDN6747927.1 LacI family transcriptional regulator [Brevibacterium sp.]
MAKQNDRPTLATVASRAGVSIKTASRVLNGEKHVAASTAEKVEDAAAELGFRLNSTARRLRAGGRSPYIGVIMSDGDDPFQGRLFALLEAELGRAGLRPVVTVTTDDPERERAFLDECLANDMSGICVIRSHPEAARFYAEAASADVRIVSFDPTAAGPGIDLIAGDEERVGRLAALQLLDHGHISIGVIGDHSTSPITADRLAGIQSAFAGRSDVGWRAYMQEDARDLASAKNVVAAWLGSRSAPSALITLSATLTQGAIDACRRLDQWPALVGIDDFPTAHLLDVTVIDRDIGSMAAEAVRRLQGASFSGPDAGAGHGSDGAVGSGPSPRRWIVPVHMIARGSGEEPPDK